MDGKDSANQALQDEVRELRRSVADLRAREQQLLRELAAVTESACATNEFPGAETRTHHNTVCAMLYSSPASSAPGGPEAAR